MSFRSRWQPAALAIAVLAASAPAQAQKAQDTVRLALHQPLRVVDVIYNPHPETSLIADVVFDGLVYFDDAERQYKPLLAKSWTRVSPTTYEFKLRDDVKFHDGSAFDADDVLYSFHFFRDPKYAFRFKDSRFGWIDKVEKVDPYTVRISSKGPFAPFLARIATGTPIYPSDVHGALANKEDFGRKPVGTGPYKVLSVNPSKGEALYERNDAYHLGDVKPAGSVKRIAIGSVPDQQTQVAKLLAGELDLVYDVQKDLAESLRANPDLAVDAIRGVTYAYILFDTADRSGIHVFKDKRVREALLKAIDRPALHKAFLPKEMWNDPMQAAMCYPWHVGCAWSAEPPAHDIAGAKKLLAEAGYPNGFDLELTTWGVTTPIAEAVAGQLRTIGINAKVASSTIGVFVKKRAENKVQTFVSLWDNGVANPDIESTMSFFFLPSSRNYIGDKALADAVAAGRVELDPKKREAIYRAAFDRVTNERFMMPLVPIPAIVVHRKDLRLVGKTMTPEGFDLNRLAWH